MITAQEHETHRARDIKNENLVHKTSGSLSRYLEHRRYCYATK